MLNAMVFQYITFEAMLPMFPGDPTSTNFTYPSQPGPNFLNPDDPLSAGVIAIFLGGNNQTALDIPAGTNTAASAPAGTNNTQLSLNTWLTPSSTDQLGTPVKFWTNMLQNASLNEHWYPYTGGSGAVAGRSRLAGKLAGILQQRRAHKRDDVGTQHQCDHV